ncbi:hypothetical protein VNO77_19366 [Canavalia gladiata]|uniref:Uncharacterized protein n=1 Tax=Canavalia gladiata TaxID=3824 RepID=A0AAN9QLB3_CANGL
MGLQFCNFGLLRAILYFRENLGHFWYSGNYWGSVWVFWEFEGSLGILGIIGGQFGYFDGSMSWTSGARRQDMRLARFAMASASLPRGAYSPT